MAIQPRSNFLIVENDPNDAFFIKRALARSGSTYICENPTEAKAYLLGSEIYANRAKFPLPQMILTDLHMGGECGVQFVQWLRDQLPPLRDTAVVVLTGSATVADSAAAHTAGALSVIEKPTRLQDLEDILTEVTTKYCATLDK